MLKLLDTSSVILVLEEIGCPEIFDHCIERGHELAITQAVYSELSANEDTFGKFNDYGRISVINDISQNSGKTYEYLKKRYPGLHEGEISVLCHASSMSASNQGHYCIIDDRAARQRRDELNIRLTGSIGLLLWGKATGCFSEEECVKIYNKIKDSGFFIHQSILELLLDD